MNENVQNAIRDFENGWVVKKDPNENFLSQTMTDTGIPLTARQMGGTERMPGEEAEGPSLLESVKEYIGNAPDSAPAPLTHAFETMTSGISNWAKDKPLYRAVMLTNEEKLLDAQKLSGIVGLNAQLLADNPFLYENAKEIADKTAKFAFLNGETFSSDNITKLYPEIDLTDPVNAAIALKHAKEVLQARSIIDPPTTITEDIMKAAGESWDMIKKSWEAGNKEFEAGELQYRAMTGELSNEEVEAKLKDIEKTEKEYSKAISNSLIATMVGETVKMGTSMTRMTLQGAEEIIAPLGPSLTMAINQMRPMVPYAATGAAAATGAIAATGAAGAIAGAGIAAAGAVAGAIALSKAAVYTGTYRAEAGSAYWDWITRKDANGRNLYTREQALSHARRVGHMNAFIETASLDMALNGISKAIGPSAALAVIRNKAAMESLIGAGRGAIAKKAGVYAGKQIAKTATPEILEEGLQQAVGDIDENIFGKSTHSTREIIGNAVDAMIQAVPASVGMALGGAAIAGVGTYRGMRRISKLSSADLKDTVTEFKRENERSLIQNLMKFRDGADLYKKSPEAYRKTIQKQLEDNALGTIYIDVQTAAENEKTHAALNHLVESGTITAQELDTAIKEGKPLELETGKFMQTATPEIHEALSDFTTMDRGEKTIHAIREERERYKAMVDFASMTKEKREAAAAQKILDERFSEDSEKGREDRATAAELLSGGIDRLQENYKAMLEEAKNLWGDLTGVKTYQDYMNSKEGGVEFLWMKDQEGFDVSKRISNNETWYREFWEKKGRAPTQRELYDVAHDNLAREYGHRTEEDVTAAIHEMEAAKKRVESLERIGETLKSLEKEDLIAQTLLDPETYEEAYKPLLKQITEAGNKEVTKAARDSTLILAKIAENFHKNYGVPLKLATIQVGNLAGAKAVQPKYYQRLASGERIDKSLIRAVATITGKELGDIEDISGLRMAADKYYRDHLQGTTVHNELLGEVRFDEGLPKSDVEFFSLGRKKAKSTTANPLKALVTVHLPELIEQAEYIASSAPQKEKHSGNRFYFLYSAVVINGNKVIVVTNVMSKENGTIQYYNHKTFTEEEYREIENASNQVVSDRGTSPGGRVSMEASSISNIYQPDVIYKRANKREEEMLHQAAGEKDLVIYHNVTAGKLRDAIGLGGLPMPSLAITKKDIPFDNFGEITLIGNKDMIDPRKSKSNEVFSRDAYTVRKPAVEYEEPSKKDEAAFQKKYEGTRDELQKKGILVRDINLPAYTGEEALSRLMSDEAIRYFYIKNVLGKNVQTKSKVIAADIPHQALFETYPDILHALKDPKVEAGDFSDLNKAARPYFEAEEKRLEGRKGLLAGRAKRRLAAMQRDGHITQEGVETLKKQAKAYEAAASEKPKKVVDQEAFRGDMQKIIEKEGMGKFEVFVHSEWENLYKEKYLWDNGKKLKFTIDNIVKLMKKYRGTNNEGAGGINYGFNSLLAFLSKKFTSIKDIKGSESSLASNEKELAQYKKAEAMYNDLRDEAAKLQSGRKEDLDLHLAEFLKAIRDGEGSHHFPENEAFAQHAKAFLEEAGKVTAGYFEAKPARKVTFDEFSGAVVPKGTPKETIDFLESQGIQVTEYDMDAKGDREAKTAALAEGLQVYFQNSGKYQGSYDKTTNAIELFDGANESTVIHEGAHMFLSILENMAALDEATLSGYFQGDAKKANASLSKMRADLSAIREWAAFSEERLGEYKGTALEKEFTQHAEDIKAGKAGAEERWMQERFARGFEKYLMEGSAPTKEMQGVFRRFKKWFTDIYKATKNLGNVTFTPEVKDIFDKMIATEEEINAWAAQRKLESIDRVVDVNSSEMGNLRAWAESVKEKAHEKAMSYYLRMVKEDAIEDFRNTISSEDAKMEFIKNLGEENEIYQIETIYNSDTFPTAKDKKEFLAMSGHTEESFKQKLKEAGGTTEERWNAHIEDMLTHYKEEALTPEAVKQMAEEILNSPEGLQKKSRIEAMLLEQKVTQYINLVTSMQLELKRSKDKTKTAREIRKRLGLVSETETTELDKQSATIARSEEKISKLEKQVENLKAQLTKARAEEAKAKEEGAEVKETASILEGNLHAIEAELERERRAHEKDNETHKDSEATVLDLSGQLKDMVEGLRESRKAMKIDLALIKEDARNTLGGESLSHATSWRWWLNKAQIEEGRAMQAAAKNDWDGAAYHKQAQAQCLIMAKEARKNEDEIRRTLHGGGGKVTTALLNENGMEKYGILGILNRISRTDKPVMMKDDARYFVQHMAYVLGLAKKDGILPIDSKGQERPFNWHWLAVEMNPMQAMDNPNYMAEDIIPSWMRQAFDGNEPKKLSDLTMDQFREMAKTMKAVYKLGRREYEGNTLGTSFDNATKEITDEIYDNWTHRTVIPQVKAQTDTAVDRVKAKAHSLVKDITLPEVLIERMGKKAYQYFYKPIDKAAGHLREMKQSARKTFRQNFDMYSRKEWTAMRSKRLYAYGIDDRGNPMQWTKEQLIAMALNFGTKSNRQRLIETLWGNEADLLDFLDKNLTNKDWDFVESVWNHVNSYWGERNRIQNDLYGTPLGKVKGENFTLKSGRVIHGQYYRIKYDPTTSSKTGRNQANDIAKMDMENASAFSLGMGSTKQRAATSGGQKLRLDLDVYVEAVNEAMQHIAMREATVDVYKLLTRKEIVQCFELTTGPETIRMLQEWAKDNWHSSIKEMAEWDSMLGRARRRFNFTTMGFRLSTALLNIGNITGMMERMGSMNALKACWDFYKNPTDIAERMRFIQSKSSMMNDRRATIDRDMYIQDRIPVGRNESELRSLIEHGKYGVDALNKNAYWFIQFTDGVFSYPEWLHTYRTALVELEAEGKLSREEMDAEAVRRADKMVRETFGSNEIKDQTQFSRDNGILAQMTSFFSYTNLVTNQFIRAGYILYDKGDIRPLLAATWYWWILGAAIETAIRVAADDSDDEDKWAKKAIHVFASNGPFGGVPLIREIVPWTVDFFVGKKPFGSAAPDAPAFDMVKHTENFLKAMEKEDYIEAGRGISKAITRSSIPIPDTIVDAFWNFMRLTCTDNTYTVQQFIWKSLWDKSMKKGGEKK